MSGCAAEVALLGGAKVRLISWVQNIIMLRASLLHFHLRILFAAFSWFIISTIRIVIECEGWYYHAHGSHSRTWRVMIF